MLEEITIVRIVIGEEISINPILALIITIVIVIEVEIEVLIMKVHQLEIHTGVIIVNQYITL